MEWMAKVLILLVAALGCVVRIITIVAIDRFAVFALLLLLLADLAAVFLLGPQAVAQQLQVLLAVLNSTRIRLLHLSTTENSQA